VKKRITLMAIVVFAGTAACSHAAPNPLLGTWTLDPSTNPSPYCVGPLTFTAKSYTAPDLNGKLTTYSVNYVLGNTTTFPTTVYVTYNNGGVGHGTYIFRSANKMVVDTYLQCTYVK
jgi:hypothetical protein